jgi:prephenate dehydrogenase
MRIGIIGFGQFGQLLARLLPRSAEVLAFDTAEPAAAMDAPIVRFAPFAEVCAADIIAFCVPVQALEATIVAAAPHVRPGAWALDVASVKTLPAQWMAANFAPEVNVTATHPLFGPQSAKRGLTGQKLVICPIRGAKEPILARYAQSLGLDVVFSDPAAHDAQMAHVQALTHLIGKAIVATGRPDLDLVTESYKHLIELSRLVEFDSKELFSAIQCLNPHARVTTARFKSAVNALLREANAMNNAPLFSLRAGDEDA